MKKVLASVCNIDNLNASAFLNATGKQLQLQSEKLTDRSAGIIFVRFTYHHNPADINPRIKQKPTVFSFCLRLPQHRYFKIEDRIEEILSPVSKKSPKKSRMARIFDTPTKLFSTPSNDDTEEKEDSGSRDCSEDTNGTPKMNVLFGGGNDMML